MTQRQVADKLGANTRQVMRWEGDQNRPDEYLADLIRVLRVSRSEVDAFIQDDARRSTVEASVQKVIETIQFPKLAEIKETVDRLARDSAQTDERLGRIDTALAQILARLDLPPDRPGP